MSKRRAYVAGNWKMNTTLDEAITLADGLKRRIGRVRAVDMAVRRAELLIGENITLPLTRDKERVLQLIREKEEDDWKGIVRAMNNAFYYE